MVKLSTLLRSGHAKVLGAKSEHSVAAQLGRYVADLNCV